MSVPKDVFRLVSLRGADTRRSLEPGRQRPARSRTRSLDAVGKLWRTPGPKLAEAARKVPYLDASDLKEGLPWLDLAVRFGKNPDTKVKDETVKVDGETLPLRRYAHTPQFDTIHDWLTASWLALQLRRRAGEPVPNGLVAIHEATLRFAEVIRRIGADTYTPADASALRTVPLVVPAGWRNPTSPRPPGTSNGSGAQQPAQRVDDKANRATAVSEARALQDILIKATLLYDDSGETSVDEKFFAALGKSLREPARTVLTAFLQENGTIRNFNDFTGGVQQDLDAKLTTANDLCKRIQVYERSITEQLPEPRKPTTKARPAITALGWGDLLVVREELIGYEAREVSHIDNVLAGESTGLEHERSHQLETLVENEDTIQTTSEHDRETTDRFELQVESTKSIAADFAVPTSVNTSSKYGLTTVDTSVAVELNRTTEEATRSATRTAHDVIDKAITRTQTTARELRRTTTTDTIRELSTHAIDNTTKGVGGVPAPRSGIYLWVEKVQRLQLYEYGKRFMIEFAIPEPGLSLIEASQPVRPDVPKPLPLAIGPNDITEANYLCLTELYGARDVAPPPPLLIQIGDGFGSTTDDSQDENGEITMGKLLPVPVGYEPISGRYATTGRGRAATTTDRRPGGSGGSIDSIDELHVHLAIGGEVVLDSGVELQGTSDAGGLQSYQSSFVLTAPSVSDDKGIPITARFANAYDNTATMNVYLKCRRSSALFASWQLDTYQRLLQAHNEMETRYQESLRQAQFGNPGTPVFGGRPSAQNRAIERDELKKWAIGLMRGKSYAYDAVVQGDGVQQLDPVAADEQAPIVRFFEQAFEWDQMSYLLEPYFWGRTASWTLRQHITVPDDPKHEAFLRAGSARLIVPVTAGHETRLLAYLDSEPGLPEWQQDLLDEWDPGDPNQRIPPTPRDLSTTSVDDVLGSQYPNMWLELLEDAHPDILRGAGHLEVKNGNEQARLKDTDERVTDRDIGREVYIDGESYNIVSYDDGGRRFTLDRRYTGPDNDSAAYAIGSVKRGAPWNVRIPTNLVVLAANRADLGSLG